MSGTAADLSAKPKVLPIKPHHPLPRLCPLARGVISVDWEADVPCWQHAVLLISKLTPFLNTGHKN